MVVSSPAFRLIDLVLPLMTISMVWSVVDLIFAKRTLPSRQVMSASMPPRAHIPFTLPSFQALGKAGRNLSLPS